MIRGSSTFGLSSQQISVLNRLHELSDAIAEYDLPDDTKADKLGQG